MTFKCSKTADGTMVQVKGGFRQDISIPLSDTLEKLVQKKVMSIILDLSEVEFLDSSCLGLIIFSSKRIKEYGGKIAIKNPQPGVEEIIEDSHLTRIVSIEKDKN